MNKKLATFSIAALLALVTFTGCDNKKDSGTIEADSPDKSAQATETITQDIKEEVKAVENSTIIEDMEKMQGQAVEIKSDTIDKAEADTQIIADDAKLIEKDIGIDTNASPAEANTTVAASVTEASAPAQTATADNDLGKKVYTKCVACHGPKANLKALGKSEIIAGWPTQKIVEALEGYKAGMLNTHGMGATMKGIATPLSKEDMEAVAQYISDMQ